MTLAAPIMVAEEVTRSPWAMAWLRFRRNILAMVGGVALALIVIVCFATLPATLDAYNNQHELKYVLQEPGMAVAADGATKMFPLGTDKLGRDLLSRLLVGGAISLAVGLASAAIAVVIGTSVGMLAGYIGGRVDAFLMRVVDVLYGLPYILLVILMRVTLVPVLTALLKDIVANPGVWANVTVLLVGIASVSWLTMARVVRGQVLSLRDQPFVEAARAMGFSNFRILRKHILPNLVGPILVYATLTVPQAILSESFLSFLGLGIQPPLPSWGNLASDGVEALNPIHTRWWLIVWPCVALSVTLLCLNFVGDGLRDALDPKANRG